MFLVQQGHQGPGGTVSPGPSPGFYLWFLVLVPVLVVVVLSLVPVLVQVLVPVRLSVLIVLILVPSPGPSSRTSFVPSSGRSPCSLGPISGLNFGPIPRSPGPSLHSPGLTCGPSPGPSSHSPGFGPSFQASWFLLGFQQQLLVSVATLKAAAALTNGGCQHSQQSQR